MKVAVSNLNSQSPDLTREFLLNNLLDNIPDTIYFKDRESRFILVNRAAVRNLGLGSAQDAVGKSDADIFSRDHAEAARRDELEIMRTGNPLIGQVEKETWPDGSETWVSTSKMPLRNGSGEIIGTFGISRDVTASKKAEIAIEKARIAAESAYQVKGQFLANVSHEIRTPMNGIIGMTGLLLDTEMTSDQRGFIRTIRKCGDNLLTIINEILDFSKIESGAFNLEQVPFDLSSSLEDALDLFGIGSTEKNLELGCLCGLDTPATLLGDPTRLRQILVNLLGNSVKFTEKGEVILEVSCERDCPPETLSKNAYLRTLDDKYKDEEWVLLTFQVRDTGPGIPEEGIQRLFKPFSQVDASITRRHGGTGLGLVISKHLVEAMGGKIWVESSIGVGTTFYFSLYAKVAGSAPQAKGEVSPELKGRHLLIVDDGEINRRILTIQAEGWAMVPHVFEKPADALSWLKEEPHLDAAILDLHMPGMDGFELGREIRALPKFKELPLILLGSCLPEIKADAHARDVFSTRLMKPIKQSEVAGALASILGDISRGTRSLRTNKIFDSAMATRLPLKILIAEDNAVNQKVATHVLKQFGYASDLAANGKEAVDAVERQDYDLIFMDVQMPDMDGLHATRVIRALRKSPRSPCIIAMTANASAEDRALCMEAGMDDFLSKPVRAQEIKGALEKAAKLLRMRRRA